MSRTHSQSDDFLSATERVHNGSEQLVAPDNFREHVEQHYGRGRILDSIIAALRQSGKDLTRLEPEDLAPVDEFHVRGREATVELAGRAALNPGILVLDVGCGLGGSARTRSGTCAKDVLVYQARAEKR